jgi:hypothetical protein
MKLLEKMLAQKKFEDAPDPAWLVEAKARREAYEKAEIVARETHSELLARSAEKRRKALERMDCDYLEATKDLDEATKFVRPSRPSRPSRFDRKMNRAEVRALEGLRKAKRRAFVRSILWATEDLEG